MRLEELKSKVLSRPLPKNIGVILDGNGRWAKKRLMPRVMGHAKGIKTLVEIARVCREINISSLTVYAFSTENWNRPSDEVSFLMNALINSFDQYKEKIIKNKVKVKVLGERTNLNEKILKAINEIEEATKDFDGFVFNICFNYGGRQEIVHAVKNICSQVLANEISVDEINTDTVSQNLYSSPFVDMDLIIRTSGEERLSNFLLWQCAYSEFIFTKTYWPDFHEKELFVALDEFQSRNRRFGGLENKNGK